MTTCYGARDFGKIGHFKVVAITLAVCVNVQLNLQIVANAVLYLLVVLVAACAVLLCKIFDIARVNVCSALIHAFY